MHIKGDRVRFDSHCFRLENRIDDGFGISTSNGLHIPNFIKQQSELPGPSDTGSSE